MYSNLDSPDAMIDEIKTDQLSLRSEFLVNTTNPNNAIGVRSEWQNDEATAKIILEVMPIGLDARIKKAVKSITVELPDQRSSVSKSGVMVATRSNGLYLDFSALKRMDMISIR